MKITIANLDKQIEEESGSSPVFAFAIGRLIDDVSQLRKELDDLKVLINKGGESK